MKSRIVLGVLFAFSISSAAKAGIALRGEAQRWEAPCEETTPGEWRCGSPDSLLETRSIELPLELPARPGDGAKSEASLFEGVTLRVFAVWPARDEPVVQTRIDLRGAATCATTDYLRTEKLSPLVCAARVGSRLVGVTLHELRIR